MMMTRREFGMTMMGAIAGVALRPSEVRALTPMRAVDCHAHVFSRDLPMPDKRRAPSGYDATAEDYINVLKANGMTNGVLVQPSFLGIDNGYLVRTLQKYPSMFRGIAVVEPTISVRELDGLDRAGVVGIRLNQIGLPVPDFASVQWQALLSEIKTRHWQVEVHQIASDLKPIMDPLLDKGINVVVDHFGRPNPKLGVEDTGFQYLLTTASTRQVWVKLSGAYRNGRDGLGDQIATQAIPLLKTHFGLDRLVWGSDWPHTLYEKEVNYSEVRRNLNTWIPDEAERQIILSQVPVELFRF